MEGTQESTTTPDIPTQIAQIAQDVRDLVETKNARSRQLSGLSTQLDLFLASEISFSGLLAQLVEVYRKQFEEMRQMNENIATLERTVHGVLDLVVGDPALHAALLERERNGRN